MLLLGQIGPITAAVIDCAFLFVLALMMWREVIAGKNIRNAPVCILTTLLAASNVGFHVGAASFEIHELSEHFAIGVIARSGLGHGDRASGTGQKPCANDIFKLCDGTGYGRRADIQCTCGGGKAAFFHHAHEIL